MIILLRRLLVFALYTLPVHSHSSGCLKVHHIATMTAFDILSRALLVSRLNGTSINTLTRHN